MLRATYIGPFCKKTVLLAMVLFSSLLSIAQPPFLGGQGDGYASTTLELSTTSLNLHQDHWELVYPSGSTKLPYVVFTRLTSPGRLTLMDAQGRSLKHWQVLPSNPKRLLLPPLPPGLYFLRWTQTSAVHTRKLKIIP